ncbi:hypothetical protein CDAR_528811 [Caerostris darwini]|uniref:Uncharacterized protein n=1 Tax=Caerostris darwini TaxID=1538125 RepID=A0AAV4UNT2_9ARAC|nr:hypothetical protein CDAR_528811 [Caerostris darwini]
MPHTTHNYSTHDANSGCISNSASAYALTTRDRSRTWVYVRFTDRKWVVIPHHTLSSSFRFRDEDNCFPSISHFCFAVSHFFFFLEPWICARNQ